MSNEKSEWWIEGAYTNEDLGAIIKNIREDYLKVNQEGLAREINVKLTTLQSCESGKGNHIGSVLSRICEKYELKTVLQIKAK